MCLWNPETEMMSRWRFDMLTHLSDRKRDIHVSKRGSEAASGEQPDKLRKTVRFEQEASSSSAAASSDPCVA